LYDVYGQQSYHAFGVFRAAFRELEWKNASLLWRAFVEGRPKNIKRIVVYAARAMRAQSWGGQSWGGKS
jgi:hypothetical protein